MTVTASDIKRLRSMINEPTATTWTDYDLTTMIEASACIDTLGNIPTDANWTATYDLYSVASKLWLEKAAKYADEFDFSADGGSFQRSQKQMMMLKQASYFESRSKALGLQLKQYPITHAPITGFEDTPYKDDIDDYESELK